MHLRLEQYTSPFSPLLLVTDETGAFRALDFADYEPRMHRLLREHYGDYELEEVRHRHPSFDRSTPILMAT